MSHEHITALVLDRQLTGENHLRLSLLEPVSGRREVFYRQSAKAKATPPDLFDLGDYDLQEAKGGGAWFVREYHLRHRHAGISAHYRSFQIAGEWARFLRHNALHCHEPAMVFDIAARTFAALETGQHSEAVLLKGLYLFARQEGWPVKEAWLQGLPASEKKDAVYLLNTPLEELQLSPDSQRRLYRALKNWLAARDEVEIR